MRYIASYLLSVITAALLVTLLNAFWEKNKTSGGIGKLISGLALVLIVIRPLLSIRMEPLLSVADSAAYDTNEIIAAAQDAAAQSQHAVIKSRSEAYILDKAASLGSSVCVSVHLEDAPPYAPCGVTITGSVSPYIRQTLSQWIADNFAIAKENQIWTG